MARWAMDGAGNASYAASPIFTTSVQESAVEETWKRTTSCRLNLQLELVRLGVSFSGLIGGANTTDLP